MPYKDYPKRCDRCDKSIKAPRLDFCDSTAKTIVTFTFDHKRYDFTFRLGSGTAGRYRSEDDAVCFPCVREMALRALDVLEGDYQPKARKAVA